MCGVGRHRKEPADLDALVRRCRGQSPYWQCEQCGELHQSLGGASQKVTRGHEYRVFVARAYAFIMLATALLLAGLATKVPGFSGLPNLMFAGGVFLLAISAFGVLWRYIGDKARLCIDIARGRVLVHGPLRVVDIKVIRRRMKCGSAPLLVVPAEHGVIVEVDNLD